MKDAKVTIQGVVIDRVASTGRAGRQTYEYDGEVKLQARCRSLNIAFAQPFRQSESIPRAIEEASKALERELGELALACSKVMEAGRGSAEDEEDETEALEDNQ